MIEHTSYFSDKKVIIVGPGRWGRNHVEKLAALLPHDSLGIYEPEPENLVAATESVPGCKVYPSYETVLTDESVAGVVITAPAVLHARLAEEALEAGKHVFVEKPLALEVSQGAALIDLAERVNLTLMVGHILMYDPAVDYLRNTYADGELGDIKYALLERAKLGTVRTVEDVIFSLASHDISLITYILGIFPESVSCSGASALNKNIVDAAFIDLNYPGGSIAHIIVSWLHPIEVRRMVLVGSEKMVSLDELNAPRLTVFDKGARYEGDEVVLYDNGTTSPDFPKTDLLNTELSIFLDCIATGRRPASDGRQALNVLKIMRAAQKSLSGRGTPVILENGG